MCQLFSKLMRVNPTLPPVSTLIKPQITFNTSLQHIPFDQLMMNFTKSIE